MTVAQPLAARSVWDDVVGQDTAVARLRAALRAPVHAYLFVGPPGSTKDAAARAFAAELISGSDDATSRDGRLALMGEHPDIHEVERAGASISVAQAAEIVRQAWLAPNEGDRKVMILHEFHLLDAMGAGKLLKTIEEPPRSAYFVVLADFVPADLITISSRCVRVEFGPIAADAITCRLITEGADPDAAAVAASAAAGDLDSARLLVNDADFSARRAFFAALPSSLDGSGNRAVVLAAETLTRIETAAAPLVARHAAELAALAEREQQSGSRGSGRAVIEARHKRELRRHRTDELRRGFAALASCYRSAIIERRIDPDSAVAAVERLGAASEALDHNPNETLLLQSLYWALPPLRAAS